MNIKQLAEIIKLFEDSSLVTMELHQGDEKVKLSRAQKVTAVAQPIPQAVLPAPEVPAQPPVQDAGPDFNHIVEVKSPVVGVYYEAPEPGGKPFVAVGDQVKKGDILCLIEVMKQVTEVVAPQDGQVADICLTNGSVVEYGQTLVKLY